MVPDDCAILTINPSVVLFHAKNKSYSIQNLFNEDFIANHSECKVILYDVFCPFEHKGVCEMAKSAFPQETLFSESYSFFEYELTLLREKQERNSEELSPQF